jgi:CBS domain containing-hemolysin-like protein
LVAFDLTVNNNTFTRIETSSHLIFPGDKSHLNAVHHEEVAIIGGALKFRDTMVSEVMTPLEDCFMIPATEKLSYKVRIGFFCVYLLCN